MIRHGSCWFRRIATYGCLIGAAGLIAVAAGAAAPKAQSASKPATGPAEVYDAWPFDAKEAIKRQDETAKAMGVRKEAVVDLGGKVSMKFILIPAGKFMMGSPGSQREVTIPRPYYLGVYKVTQAHYKQVMGKDPSPAAGKDFPVSVVTWQDAEEFCRQASKKTRKSIHLLTEAQWENACRAGADTRFFFGDDESKLGEYVWYRENMGGRMHAVGQKKPNAWGLYDINGLMWEYCLTGAGDSKAAETDAAKSHVMRGATWGSRPPMFVMGVSLPVLEDPKGGLDRCGMRVAMDAE